MMRLVDEEVAVCTKARPHPSPRNPYSLPGYLSRPRRTLATAKDGAYKNNYLIDF